MNLKFSNKKGIISIIVIAVVFVLVNMFIGSQCAIVGAPVCSITGTCCSYCEVPITLYKSCVCSCSTWFGLLQQIVFVIAPGLLGYVILSFFEKKE